MTFIPTTASEQLMFAVRRIEAYGGGKKWFGTGFYFEINLPDSRLIHTIVTNKHVLQDAERVNVLFHTGRNGIPDGRHFFHNITSENSFGVLHPTYDLALIGIGSIGGMWTDKNDPERKIFITAIGERDLITDAELQNLSACESVTMIGCPDGQWDAHNGFPIFRRGVTATHPIIDYEGRSEFVIDIGAYSGSSGSPVMLLDEGIIVSAKDSAWIQSGTRMRLLGVLWGGPRITEAGEVVAQPAPGDTKLDVKSYVRMHLGYVVKARELAFLAQMLREKIIASGA